MPGRMPAWATEGELARWSGLPGQLGSSRVSSAWGVRCRSLVIRAGRRQRPGVTRADAAAWRSGGSLFDWRVNGSRSDRRSGLLGRWVAGPVAPFVPARPVPSLRLLNTDATWPWKKRPRFSRGGRGSKVQAEASHARRVPRGPRPVPVPARSRGVPTPRHLRVYCIAVNGTAGAWCSGL